MGAEPTNNSGAARSSDHLSTFGETSAAAPSGAAPEAPTERVEQPGSMIGAFRLVEEIGEGGFGVVWLAERREPIVQRVALKIIKPGMDSKAVVARFEQERQTLALMDHAGIAKVFDAGTTPPALGSRPYFVMEYVKGEPITTYCDRNRLATRDRLALFVKVCDAVQHAHTKGIIHRDLKPSNVLVVAGDPSNPDPTPKVIDFGVAKAITHTLSDHNIFTQRGEIVGTPEYMSPEQAEMNPTGVDTRSDVYSLGVMLYELLTGVLPFDPKTLRAAGYSEIQRIIREVDPPKPSTRLTTMGDVAADIAARHRSEPRSMSAELRRELEWVPLKAMRKNRDERYGTPADLARDVRNYLEGRPLEAGPESVVYRARKFVRRNRGPVIAALLVLLALVLGLIGTAYGLVHERRARLAEVEQRQEAEAARMTSETALGSLREMLEAADPSRRPEAASGGSDGLSLTLRNLEEGRYDQQPEVDAEIRLTVADLLRRSGRNDEALGHAQRAVEILRGLHPDDEHLADALTVLGLVQQSLGQSDCERSLNQALQIYKRLYPDGHEKVARGLNNFAGWLQANNRRAEALDMLQAALEMNRRLHPGDNPATASNLNNVGLMLQQFDRPKEAERMFLESLAMCRRIYGRNHARVAQALTNLGYCLKLQNRDEEALKFQREGLEINQHLFAGDHQEVAASLSNVGFTLLSLGRPGEAEHMLQTAVEMDQRLFAGDHMNTAAAMKNLAACLDALGRTDDALAKAREAAAMADRCLPEGHPIRVKCDQLLEELTAKAPGTPR